MRLALQAEGRVPFSERRKHLGSWDYFISKTFSLFPQILRSLEEKR